MIYTLRYSLEVVGIWAEDITIDEMIDKSWLIQTTVANKEVAILAVELVAEK